MGGYPFKYFVSKLCGGKGFIVGADSTDIGGDPKLLQIC